MSYLMHQQPQDLLLDDIFMRKFRNYVCPCGKEAVYRLSNRKAYACTCGRQQFALSGTVFHKSRTPLLKWLEAYYQVVVNPKVSAKHLERLLGVTYKTAWRMRKLIKEDLYGLR